MSRCCYGGGFTGGYTGGSNCVCDFPTLVILILIVLQFTKKNKDHHYDDDDYEGERKCKNDQIGNGILFIIALFFLSCAGCGKH